MERRVEVPAGGEQMGKDQLEMVLLVVVGLVVVIAEVGVFIIVFTCRVVGAVFRKRVLRNPFPGLVGPFKTREGDEFEGCLFPIIACRKVV